MVAATRIMCQGYLVIFPLLSMTGRLFIEGEGRAFPVWIHSALVTGEASAWLWWWYPGQGDNEGLLAQNCDTSGTTRWATSAGSSGW